MTTATKTAVEQALEGIDQFNAIRQRRLQREFLSDSHQHFAQYIMNRDLGHPVDYALLRRALGEFGTRYLAPVLQEQVRPLIQGVTYSIDLGAGSGWVSRAMGYSATLVDRPGASSDPDAGLLVQGDLEDPSFARWVIEQSGAQLAIVSEFLHCLPDPRAFVQSCLREVGSLEWVLVIEQEDMGDDLSAQIRRDLGPGNRLLSGEGIFSLFGGFDLHHYTCLRQYSFWLWRVA